MDKPDLKIRARSPQQELSFADASQNQLNARRDSGWTLNERDNWTQITIEVVRPESPETDRFRVTRVLSHADVESFLNAADKILSLLRARERMQEKTPRNGIEFSIDVLDGLKIGAFESLGKDPAWFIDLSSKHDNVRFQFGTIEDWDLFKEAFQYAR